MKLLTKQPRSKFWGELADTSKKYQDEIAKLEDQRQNELEENLKYLSNIALLALIREANNLKQQWRDKYLHNKPSNRTDKELDSAEFVVDAIRSILIDRGITYCSVRDALVKGDEVFLK
ncbi:hypothetical protein [Anabaena azotica]|uniref:Uncharacterized protein n=1 Tax=Anabaena azotica FACHB-119 TaxID=947527 RepID=A0ABR8CZD6_9NOST|nr:hypothetical protein [Anabaena azotica]MBD2499849.1 hypothetical protein [Anabaena azotica FACHB-119]